ncbi:MAG: ABC transporter ATP-binding protein [Syntrophales bacterium]|nr:ABC transporter ATP-binding protein [Syntrophales bacterium]
MNNPLLEVKNLATHFDTEDGRIRAVDGVDFTVSKGDTLGVVGESGCGKTVLALSITRLVASPPGRIVSGEVILDGADLLKLSGEEMRRIRGRDISMIFQEPMTSLNPVLKVGEQIAEAVRLHRGLSRREAMNVAVEMLHKVGMPAPERRAYDYPHQMSGGMRQRVMIAMALSCNPKLVLADEPTTALDVTIQAQIIDLINIIKEEAGVSVIQISQDLGVIAEEGQFVDVKYAGSILEYSPKEDLFSMPLHPYTVGLMSSLPGVNNRGKDGDCLKAIPGSVPLLYALPGGCRFHDRCSDVMEICRKEEPELKAAGEGACFGSPEGSKRAPSPGSHTVRCWKYA